MAQKVQNTSFVTEDTSNWFQNYTPEIEEIYV